MLKFISHRLKLSFHRWSLDPTKSVCFFLGHPVLQILFNGFSNSFFLFSASAVKVTWKESHQVNQAKQVMTRIHKRTTHLMKNFSGPSMQGMKAQFLNRLTFEVAVERKL